MRLFGLTLLSFLFLFSCSKDYDVIISNGTVYDGSGQQALQVDIGITNDTIAFMGDLGEASARTKIDATGMAVAPGFINMLSWANNSLIRDGRGQSDIRQGVTLEVFGEGTSMGPISTERQEEMRAEGEEVAGPPWAATLTLWRRRVSLPTSLPFWVLRPSASTLLAMKTGLLREMSLKLCGR